MIDLKTALEPLDGEFANKFWPLNESHIREVEANLGWSLPEDYKAFVSTYGLCQTASEMGVRRDDGFDPPGVGVIYGHYQDEDGFPSYSVVSLSTVPEEGMLEIAETPEGLYYLRRDGSIFFNRQGAPMASPGEDAPPSEDTVIAASFTDFLERLYEFPDE